MLVFYLCFSNKPPYCVPLAWDQTILKCLLTEKGLKFEKPEFFAQCELFLKYVGAFLQVHFTAQNS